MRVISRPRGFNLVELMITIALLAILLGLAVPYFGTMIRNTRVRSVSDALQNGVRTAQAEAVRRNRQVVFYLTNAEPALNAPAAANGNKWSIQTVPQALDTSESATFVQGGALTDLASGVTITGATPSLCFNSAGRLANNPAPGVPGANCVAAGAQFDMAATGADRPLRVTVTLGGQTRMCDPAHTQSAAWPEGC